MRLSALVTSEEGQLLVFLIERWLAKMMRHIALPQS